MTDQRMFEPVVARLGALEDERATLDTLYRYVHAFDDRRYDDVLDCFTPDGAFILVVLPDEEPLFERRGAVALRGFLEEHDLDRPGATLRTRI